MSSPPPPAADETGLDGDADLLARYDPFANGTGDVPYPLLHAWRARHPVAKLPTGYYFASRYDDVHAALRDGGPVVDAFSHEGKMRALDVIVPEEERLIGEIEGPRHTRLRRLLMSALHPSLVSDVRDFVEKLCDSLLDDLLVRGEGDLVADYAVPIPCRTLARVFDLPDSDYRSFRAWTVAVVNGPYPTRNGGPFGPGLRGAVPEFADYIDRLAEERRRAPREDLLSRLVAAEVDGERFSPTQIRSTVAHLIMAGNETTTNLIGNLLAHLLAHPDDRARLRADRSLLLGAVEESLRVDPPVLIQPRTLVRDLRLRGVDVPAGSRMILSLAGANHDPAVFPDPERFDLDRRNVGQHLAFGAGPHYCPGAALARLEARIAVGTFLDRIGRAELAAGFRRERLEAFAFNGPKALPVRVVERAAA
ncbi:MAG: cytochrome P450 [Myxococcota bacterium]